MKKKKNYRTVFNGMKYGISYTVRTVWTFFDTVRYRHPSRWDIHRPLESAGILPAFPRSLRPLAPQRLKIPELIQ